MRLGLVGVGHQAPARARPGDVDEQDLLQVGAVGADVHPDDQGGHRLHPCRLLAEIDAAWTDRGAAA